METVVKRFKKFQLYSIVVSMFSLIIGLLFLGFENIVTIDVFNIVIGSIIMISGLFSVVKYIYDGFANNVYKFEIINAVSLIILSLFMIFVDFGSRFFTVGIFFGVYYLLLGFVKCFYTYRFLKNNEEIYPLFLLMTLLYFVMGILCIFNPFVSFMLITRLISIFLVVGSLFEVMSASLFKKRTKNILKIFE